MAANPSELPDEEHGEPFNQTEAAEVEDVDEAEASELQRGTVQQWLADHRLSVETWAGKNANAISIGGSLGIVAVALNFSNDEVARAYQHGLHHVGLAGWHIARTLFEGLPHRP